MWELKFSLFKTCSKRQKWNEIKSTEILFHLISFHFCCFQHALRVDQQANEQNLRNQLPRCRVAASVRRRVDQTDSRRTRSWQTMMMTASSPAAAAAAEIHRRTAAIASCCWLSPHALYNIIPNVVGLYTVSEKTTYASSSITLTDLNHIFAILLHIMPDPFTYFK